MNLAELRSPLIILILLLSAAAVGLLVTALFTDAGLSGFMLPPSNELQFAGEQRFYDLRLPGGKTPDQPAPLLVVLHGPSDSASHVEYLTGWSDVAGRAGFVVLYPEGVDGFWNDGRDNDGSRAARNNIDDVAFLNWVIDQVTKEVPIDASRIYLSGVSNGGMMALRYACQESARVAGVAVFAAMLPQAVEPLCAGRLPVPAMLVCGDQDALLPYSGGEVLVAGKPRGHVLGAEETARLWARANGCTAPPTLTRLPDKDPADCCVTDIYGYGSCTDDAEVRLYHVSGGGEGLPGGKEVYPAKLFITGTRDFDCVSEALSFFQAHRRPAPSS